MPSPAGHDRQEPDDAPAADELRITLPDAQVAQDEEWCEVAWDGQRKRIRFHDYGEIYSIPGLYERLFYEELRCTSPQTVRGLLEEQLEREGVDAQELVALDVGAGNGMVGEQLADLGAATIVGVDIIPEAEQAAARDRPDVYDDYLVADLTDLGAAERERLGAHDFDCMTSVAALGFGDIPPEAFATAYDLVAADGWVAFNIKEDFLNGADTTGFSRLIRQLLDTEALELRAQCRYRHRLSCAGEPLHYVAMVASKRTDVPAGALEG